MFLFLGLLLFLFYINNKRLDRQCFKQTEFKLSNKMIKETEICFSKLQLAENQDENNQAK